MFVKILRFNRIDIDLKRQEKKKITTLGTALFFFLIAFDLFKHMSHKSCRQGMVWFDVD